MQSVMTAKPWARATEDVTPDPPILRATLVALAIGLIGFMLPWYSVRYAPPGGAVTIDGTTLRTFSQTYSGFSPEHAGFMIVPLGAYTIGENVITGAQLSGILLEAMIAVAVSTALAWPALAPLRSPALRVLRYRWAQLPISLAHAVALLIEAVGCVSFLLLGLGLFSLGAHLDLAQELGNTAQATEVASYLHISIGSGFWLVLISVLMLVAIKAKPFFTTIGIIAAGMLILWITGADSWIGPFFHSFGF